MPNNKWLSIFHVMSTMLAKRLMLILGLVGLALASFEDESTNENKGCGPCRRVCPAAPVCWTSTSTSFCDFWDDAYPVRCPARPPPVIGSGENVQILNWNQAQSNPMQLGSEPWQWTINPTLSQGLFDGSMFVGTNDQPIIILSNQIYPVSMQETLYVSARAAFAAVPYSGISSAWGIDEDPQYGSGRIAVFDEVTGLRFGWILTNNKVYILYEMGCLVDGCDPNHSFQYLVPIAGRQPGELSMFTMSFNRVFKAVTFFIDGRTVLILSRPGKLIDGRFLTDGTGTTISQTVFPAALQLQLGIIPFDLVYPACQYAKFELCDRVQSLTNAFNVACTRAVRQVAPSSVEMAMNLDELSVYQLNHIFPPCNLS